MQIGNINLMLLLALKENSKYGLEIIKDISKKTNGEMEIKQPSLYSGLSRLEKRGLITSHWEDSEIGGRRHYYTITELGLTQVKLHKDDIDNILSKYTNKEESDNVVDSNNNTQNTSNIDILDNSQKNDHNILDQKNNITNKDTEKLNKIDLEEEKIIKEINIDEILNPKNLTETKDELKPTNEDIEKLDKEKNMNFDFSLKTKKNTPLFKPYSPSQKDIPNKSFSEKMKDYVEPTNNYEESKPIINNTPKEDIKENFTNTNEKTVIDSNIESKVNNNNLINELNSEPIIEYTKNTEEINYKDILGELDAELNTSKKENTPIQTIKSNNTQINNVNSKINPNKKNEYSKKLSEILTSIKETDPSQNKIEQNSFTDNEQRFEELNRKYDGSIEFKSNPNIQSQDKNQTNIEDSHAIKTKTTGYSNISQENIIVKPFIKNKKSTNNKNKQYLAVNQFNLCRAFIMFTIIMLELGISYWCLAAKGIAESLHGSISTIYISLSIFNIIYICLMIIATTPNIKKLVLRENFSWLADISYRILLSIILIIFTISTNLFMGMINFFDESYFIQWFIPCLIILNITFSGIIGYIMNKSKLFAK